MKHPYAKLLVSSIIFVSICIILWSFPLSACTVFNKSSGDRVLFGNVENEASHYVAELHFVPPDKSQGYYGHFYIKYNGNIGGGMNDQGLCFDVAGLPSHDFITAGKAPRDLMAYLLEDCATLQDALDFFKSYYWVGHRENHLMVMDKTGASAIVEHIGNVVYIYKKEAEGQLMTNFAIANPEIRFGDYPCDRFNTATDMLESLATTVDNFQKIGKKVAHAYYPALYANIYDPNSFDIHFFNANHPGDYRTSFNLLEEFKLGSHHYILKNNQILLDVAETGHRVFTISDNAPNPFQNETSFSLSLVDNAEVIISVFDMHGKKVVTLENESRNPGSFSYTWRPDVPAGIYFCRLQINGIIETRKWIKR